MALNTNIPMGYRGAQLESPQNALMQALQIQRAQQGNALQQLQMGDVHAQRQLAIQKAQEEAARGQKKNALLQGLQSGQIKLNPAEALAAGLGREDISFLASADTLGMPKVARTLERAGAGGLPETVQLDEYGRPVGAAMAKPVELKMGDLGGKLQPYNPYTQTGPMTKTQSPDSIASNATTLRGQNMTDARARDRLMLDAAKPPGGNAKTGPMSVTLQKELLESDDAVQSAAAVVRSLKSALTQNDAAYSGYLAKPRAVLRSNLPGDSQGADATIDIDNLMTGQGLEQMKSIFGAAPTEGERKILLDMQASVDKTPAQRKSIMDRAIAAAERRAAYAASKARAIRDGSYLTDGVPAQPEAAGKTVTRTGTLNGRKVVQYSDGSTSYAD